MPVQFYDCDYYAAGLIGEITSIILEFTLNAIEQFLVAELLLLVVDHRELVRLQFVLLQLHGLAHQVGQLDHFSAFGVVFHRLFAHLGQFVDRFVVDLGEELFGT